MIVLKILNVVQGLSLKRTGDVFMSKNLRINSHYFLSSPIKRNVSYQTLMRLELYKVEKHLIGEQQYEPFVSRW